jgi:hypothetical protein
VKKRVVDVPAYTLRAYEAEIKLNQNESPYDFPEDLKEEVVRIYREKKWSRYPDFVPDSLRASLARFAGWKKEGILVGNGSNELLQATLMVFVREHTPVAIPSPTFTVYGLVSTILGATILHIPLNPDMSFNVDELIARSNEAQARVLVICTPNNPTGTVLSEDEARRILDNFSGHVLLDEAYFEFCGRTSLKLLEQYPRLFQGDGDGRIESRLPHGTSGSSRANRQGEAAIQYQSVQPDGGPGGARPCGPLPAGDSGHNQRARALGQGSGGDAGSAGLSFRSQLFPLRSTDFARASLRRALPARYPDSKRFPLSDALEVPPRSRGNAGGKQPVSDRFAAGSRQSRDRRDQQLLN